MNFTTATASTSRALGAQLGALQAASSVESLWNASFELVHQELPGRSYALFADIVDYEPSQFRYHVVSSRKPDYVPSRSLSVSGPYLARHCSIAACSFGDIKTEDPLAHQRRLAQEPDPEWDDFIALAFWRNAQPHSVFAVFGTERVSDEERAFLEYLHPILDAGLARLDQLERECSLSGLLQGYLQNSPEALAFFDSRGELRFCTGHGEKLYQRWNRALRRGQESAALPMALHHGFGGNKPELKLQHPALTELSASMNATSGGYVLRFVDTRTQGQVGELSSQALAVLQQLSPAEQRVARLVVEGLRNHEIAERLSRSPRTVEFQLHNVFRKLEIGNRLQLARLLN